MGSVSEGIRVLHVDDEPEFTGMVSEFLGQHDDRLEIETADNAEEALWVLDREVVDCVVSDYEMPGCDGIELLESVRERDPELPFVLYTGKGSETIASEAISAGVTDYLQKGSGTSQYEVLANRITNAVEKQRARVEAAQSERLLQTMAENANDILWQFTANWGKLLFINSAYEEIWSQPAAELEREPKAFLKGIHPDDRPIATDAMERVSEGESIDIEFRVNAEESFSRWVWVQGEPVYDGDGTVERVVGFARDITDRKARERKVNALHDVADHLTNASAVDEVCDRSIAASEEILNFDLSVILLESNGLLEPHAVSSGMDPAELSAMRVDSGIAGKTYRTGESILLDDVLSAAEAETDEPYRSAISVPIGKYGVFQAGTERRDAFDEGDRELAELLISHTESALDRLHHEHELRRQNERLDQFASVVSHDLRNPLSVAEGYLDLAREECDSDRLDRVGRAHDRMNALIEDLLTLAREDVRVTETAPVDLAAAVERCWGNVDTAEAMLTSDVSRRILADEGRLKQLFENLIRNAIEHGGDGVTVRVGELSEGFYLEDDGSGIPSAERETVFDAGYSTSDDGTGFGLSIVQRVVEAHDWQIRAREGTEGGARFEIVDVEFAET